VSHGRCTIGRACGAAGVIPGFALHDEFGDLAAAELDPLTISRIVTTEPPDSFVRRRSPV
jgi:hypothetical protein